MPVLILALRNSIPALIDKEFESDLLQALAPFDEVPEWAKENITQLREWLAAQDFPSGLFASTDEAQAYLKKPRLCPECGHILQGRGWDGIEEHWRARHDNILPYEEAWPLIKTGKYRSKRQTMPLSDE